ncbi:MAG: hypothetical protein AAB459_01600 [Patescibacteria group bacterium]
MFDHSPEFGLPEYESASFRSRLTTILDTPLELEAIDTYALGALDQVIELVEDITSSYRQRTYNLYPNARALEDAAITEFGLSNVNKILDHISSVADRIRVIDGYISSLEPVDTIIVPPETGRSKLFPGSETYQEPKIVPKLKTTLVILSEIFGVDISDPNMVNVRPGSVDESIIRQVGYTTIDVAKLDRVILVCDEMENVTYIFDKEVLRNLGISVSQLEVLFKSDLDEIIAQENRAGSRMNYSENFVANMVDRITTPETLPGPKSRQKHAPGQIKILRPKAPKVIYQKMDSRMHLGSRIPILSMRPLKQLASS